MKKKKNTTVSEVAQAVGHNSAALKLLDFLDRYHPDLALDYEYIMGIANDYNRQDKEVSEQYAGNSAMLQELAHQKQLISYELNWSEHELILNAIEKTNYQEQQQHANSYYATAAAIELRPLLKKSIFDKYITGDVDPVAFSAEPEYDEMVAELEQTIAEIAKNPGVELFERIRKRGEALIEDEEVVLHTPLGLYRQRERERG
jgi:hypothetical protein